MTKEINSKFILPLKLQHFAEPAPQPTPTPGEPTPTPEPTPQPQGTLTQADFDRAVSKMYEQFEQKFSKKQEEAARLASMNAEEKARYEIEQSKKEIEDMRKNFTLTQNKTECMKILAERNIDVSLADFVVAEDAETMKKNIDLIDRAFKKSVEAEVNNRLKGSTPKKDLNMPTEINKETFNKMTLDQQQELYNTNKDLYMQLIK
jgi:hypothetical protein